MARNFELELVSNEMVQAIVVQEIHVAATVRGFMRC
jgi:hypothetical protein